MKAVKRPPPRRSMADRWGQGSVSDKDAIQVLHATINNGISFSIMLTCTVMGSANVSLSVSFDAVRDDSQFACHWSERPRQGRISNLNRTVAPGRGAFEISGQGRVANCALAKKKLIQQS